ncbi:hypothetical protein EDL98_08280 [Ornithobacterium rhinotracheale]|uniref:hypothetical protein n=1 Tax=Ornithobacterium rhinotracheale TaxID=28251 RepID=UPI00129C26C3|nr:hypothetical protein [Ornithobacterium rhinotracheale]MRJ09004.1 hypothetical protein [Ornithobacterium rhinotracheale]MRJ11075.1 hypothetical protein [Ornithobacterium rhinotracheale]UOH77189.1 hypothetical protein MT996_08195 [Ornithobacterium rhinotracheale]
MESEKQLKIYENMNFYNRYERLSEKYQLENRFENYANENVIALYQELGYEAKHIKKNNFFKIEEKIENIKFYFHTCLKYGNIELIIGASDMEKNEFLLGGPFAHISKEIEILKNIEKEGYIRSPKFGNYEDLYEILKVVLHIYEDFKKEVLKSFNKGNKGNV